jgi:hypothetical protein
VPFLFSSRPSIRGICRPKSGKRNLSDFPYPLPQHRDNVGVARQVLSVQAKSITETMKEGTAIISGFVFFALTEAIILLLVLFDTISMAVLGKCFL